MTPLSAEALQHLAETRRQLRDVAGMREQRPGVFVVEGKTVVELLDQDGIRVARLNALAHGKADVFRLDDPTQRRALLDRVRLLVKRLQED